MIDRYPSLIAAELSLPAAGVNAVIGLLDQEATIPFIARYRKEATGNLDEVAITSVRDRLAQLKELDARKAAIMKSLEERNLLTSELTAKVVGATTLALLEDIYLPYRPKKRTRAMIAKEKGLEPLADTLFAQGTGIPEELAKAFVDADKGVKDAAEALAGARDIIAERVAEDAPARAAARGVFREGRVPLEGHQCKKPRAPSSRTTSTGRSPRRSPRPTACWRCAAANLRGSSICACRSARRTPSRCCRACSPRATARAPRRCAWPSRTPTAG
jgi:transcriptional accessory protein Tex/SPT6